MRSKEAQRRATKKYDKRHTKFYGLKLNKTTDAALIAALDRSSNTQGLVKAALKSFLGTGEKMTDVEVMMAAGRTEQEAEILLRIGTVVYDSVEAFFDAFKGRPIDGLDGYEDKEAFEAAALSGQIRNIDAVRVEGRTKVIMYAIEN